MLPARRFRLNNRRRENLKADKGKYLLGWTAPNREEEIPSRAGWIEG
jgi:hypothetical protein